jgi:hypothetical protein
MNMITVMNESASIAITKPAAYQNKKAPLLFGKFS